LISSFISSCEQANSTRNGVAKAAIAAGPHARHLAGAAVYQAEDGFVAGLARAAEDPEVGFVEFLPGLIQRMQPDKRILELGRRFPDNRFAIAVDAVNIVPADILLGVR
jgi:hypothetical protein